MVLLFALALYFGDSGANKYFSRDDPFECTDGDDHPVDHDYQREDLMTLKKAEGSCLPN